MFCRCNSKQLATRQTQLVDLPPVLNLQLMRFVYDLATLSKKKVSTRIEIPKLLDMAPYITRPSFRDYETRQCLTEDGGDGDGDGDRDGDGAYDVYRDLCHTCCILYRFDEDSRRDKCFECQGSLDVKTASLSTVYELSAVLRHEGASAHSGHYTAGI